jgi:hypothetical protein
MDWVLGKRSEVRGRRSEVEVEVGAITYTLNPET